MATTIIIDYTKRKVRRPFNMKAFLEAVQYSYASAKGDEDKAGDPYDACFYEGSAAALQWILEQLTVEPEDPKDEVELFKGKPVLPENPQ
jgi:hypothetical protein